MGHKDQIYQLIFAKSSVTQDSRSQSMPDCSNEENINGNLDVVDYCDIKEKLLVKDESPPHSPLYGSWFKTWPDRLDRNKTIDSNVNSQTNGNGNTHDIRNTKNCDPDSKNKISFNEAVQSISLAYSPVTKQLHLVENTVSSKDTETVDMQNLGESCDTSCKSEQQKLGHRRIEAGSFSSTVSTLSDPSTSGSLLDSDQKSLQNFDISSDTKCRKKSLTHFFNRSVFSWKNSENGNSVWKYFSKASNENLSNSPQHHIASSSALIQNGRPSNLPAKTYEEEQRHKEEYKAILVAAKKKELQDNAAKQKQHKQQLKEEERQAATAKYFLQNVLPNWDCMKNNKKTFDLWWQGLPPNIRGRVWNLAIGNDLNLTFQLYEICLSRAQARLNSPEPLKLDQEKDPECSMDVIQLDISRTFPHLGIFQDGGPYSDVLHSLLAAYVCYRPDVGYVQGMSFIAAILILNMDEANAFMCFANLLNQPLHLSAFTLNQRQMKAYYEAYNEVFCYHLPKLHKHFQDCGLTPDLYLLDWIFTVFAKAVPLDVACRIWDVFLRDGDEFIFRTALGVLYMYQHTLLEMDFLHGSQFLTRLPDDICPSQLFKSIHHVSTNIGKKTFSQIVDRCSSFLTFDDTYS